MRGEILEWRDLQIDARETSLSLNMMCSSLALHGFEALIERLERGECTGTPQSKHVERLVFSTPRSTRRTVHARF
jgi:hypothetical protein